MIKRTRSREVNHEKIVGIVSGLDPELIQELFEACRPCAGWLRLSCSIRKTECGGSEEATRDKNQFRHLEKNLINRKFQRNSMELAFRISTENGTTS